MALPGYKESQILSIGLSSSLLTAPSGGQDPNTLFGVLHPPLPAALGSNFKKLKIELPYDPPIPLLFIYLKVLKMRS